MSCARRAAAGKKLYGGIAQAGSLCSQRRRRSHNLRLVVRFRDDSAFVPDVDPLFVLVDFDGLAGFDMAVKEACGHGA